MSRVGTLISTFCKGLLLSLLGMLLSIHGKRILLVTTLHLQLVRDGIFQEETLEKLNEALRLAKFNDALRLPAVVYDKVWDDQKLQEAIRSASNGDIRGRLIDFDEAKKLSESVVAVAPEWLRYGRRDDMVNDLITLIYRQSTLNANHAMA